MSSSKARSPTRRSRRPLPDDDRSVVSVGLGYKHGAHALDLAFLQSFFHKRTTTAQPLPPYNGTLRHQLADPGRLLHLLLLTERNPP